MSHLCALFSFCRFFFASRLCCSALCSRGKKLKKKYSICVVLTGKKNFPAPGGSSRARPTAASPAPTRSTRASRSRTRRSCRRSGRRCSGRLENEQKEGFSFMKKGEARKKEGERELFLFLFLFPGSSLFFSFFSFFLSCCDRGAAVISRARERT